MFGFAADAGFGEQRKQRAPLPHLAFRPVGVGHNIEQSISALRAGVITPSAPMPKWRSHRRAIASTSGVKTPSRFVDQDEVVAAPSYFVNSVLISGSYVFAKIVKLLKVLLIFCEKYPQAARRHSGYVIFTGSKFFVMKSVLFKHRSIRKFLPTPIPEELLQECLEAASRASTCGNMQLYSLVVTRDRALRERLAPCHFNQPMVCEAPCVVTVCADVHRFTMWCEQRDADPAYDNFAWFLNASTDALLSGARPSASRPRCGLGMLPQHDIYTAGDISRILGASEGVIPRRPSSWAIPTNRPH